MYGLFKREAIETGSGSTHVYLTYVGASDVKTIYIERKQTNHFTHYDYHISDVSKQVKPHRKLMSPRSGYRGVKHLKRR